MIKSISYWSLKGGLENTLDPIQAATQAKAAGFAGLELAIAPQGALTVNTDQATCKKWGESIRSQGVVLETLADGMSWGCCPTNPDAQVRKQSIELHKAALQRAAWLGCKAMLYVPGAITIPWDPSYGPVRYDHAVEWARQGVTELAKVANDVGVDLCIENVWNGLFYSPLEFASFIDSFHDARVGAYFDVGNVLGYHQHPPFWIEILGKRIRRVHIKDFKKSIGTLSGFCDLLAGDVPWAASIQALKAIGYQGTIVAEMLPPDEAILARTSVALDRILSYGT